VLISCVRLACFCFRSFSARFVTLSISLLLYICGCWPPTVAHKITLASFHWLKAPERVQYKLATIVYRSLNGTAPCYLASDLRRLSDMPSRRRLRSSLTHQPDVRQSLCATVGDRTFAIAGAWLWNSLSPDVIACDTVPRFRRELKTFLF